MVPYKEKELYNKNAIIEQSIINIAKGRKESIAELYNLTKTSIYSFALSILKNASDAEDVLQEVYIKVYENAKQYTRQGKSLAWMITITKNLSYMKIRKRKDEIDICEIAQVLPDNSKFDSEDKILLDTVLNYLSEEERKIITLHIVSGLKHREISKILDIPLSTTLSKYNRAMKKLKNKLKEEVI